MTSFADFLSDQTSVLIGKALDGTAMRHQAIVTNIANAETPQFKALRVDFESQLKEAVAAEQDSGSEQSTRFLPPGTMKTTHAHHLNTHPVAQSLSDSSVQMESKPFEYRQDKNSVDIESEMAQLSRNSGRYNALARLQQKMIEKYRASIQGGGFN